MASLFSKIVTGEIPSNKVWEDEDHFAFLDINPITAGHTLVIPKREEDYLFDMSDVDYSALMSASKRVAEAIKKATGCERICVAVVGYEVPHAHIHLIPTNTIAEFPFPPRQEGAAADLPGMAEKIRAAF